MVNESTKLAKLWIDLEEVKNQLDSELIPITGYLEINDSDLMVAMEELSKKISNHFNRFRLVAETNKGGKQ